MSISNILRGFLLFKKGLLPKVCTSSRGVVLVVSSAVIPSDFYIRTRNLSGIAQMTACLLKLVYAALL